MFKKNIGQLATLLERVQKKESSAERRNSGTAPPGHVCTPRRERGGGSRSSGWSREASAEPGDGETRTLLLKRALFSGSVTP